jgi:hypothetical protein
VFREAFLERIEVLARGEQGAVGVVRRIVRRVLVLNECEPERARPQVGAFLPQERERWSVPDARLHPLVRVLEPHLPVESVGARIWEHEQDGPAIPAGQREDVLAGQPPDTVAETIGTYPEVVEHVLAAVLCNGEEAHDVRALVDDLEAEMLGEIRLIDHQQGQSGLEVARGIVPVRLRCDDHLVDLGEVRLARPPHPARRCRRPRRVRHRLDICHVTRPPARVDQLPDDRPATF